MNKFLKELKNSSLKLMDKQETNELVSFYEEIIKDRLSAGEELEDVLKDYDVNQILKEVIPNKVFDKTKSTFKTAFKVLIFLFSTPLLIPLAILYLVLLIVFISLSIAFVAVGFASIFQLIFYLIESFKYTTSFPQILGIISLGVLASVLLFYISCLLSYLLYQGLKKIITTVLDIAFKKRGQHENI